MKKAIVEIIELNDNELTIVDEEGDLNLSTGKQTLWFRNVPLKVDVLNSYNSSGFQTHPRQTDYCIKLLEGKIDFSKGQKIEISVP